MRTPPPLVVLVLGGAAERWACPVAESPLAMAATPQLDRLASEGRVFGVQFSGSPDSAAALLSILGLDPARHETAVASYLAALGGVELAPHECVLCADFVSLFRNMIADSEPGPFRPAEAGVLFEAALTAIEGQGVRLLPGTGTHHLAVAPRDAIDPQTPSPMFALGRELDHLRPQVARHALVHRLGREALDGHEINEVRRDLGENGADMIWLWGAGGRARIEQDFSNTSAFGKDPLWRGIAKVAGIEIKAANAKTPTGMVRGVSQALAADAVCFVHTGRCTADARRREATTRTEGLEAVDKELVGPLARAVVRRGGRMLVLPAAAWSTEGGHPLSDAVPALLWGAGINSLTALPFTEAAAAASGEPVSPGHGLLAYVQRF